MEKLEKVQKWLLRIVVGIIILVVLYNAALEWKWYRENKRSEKIEQEFKQHD